MALIKTYNNKPPPESFGQKVKHISETLGAMKGIYDIGKGVYGGIQTAMPYIRAGLTTASALL